MPTRANSIAQQIDGWAKLHPAGALMGVLVGGAVALACALMGLFALLVGPIGVELLENVPGILISRLALLQGAAVLGLLSYSAVVVFVTCWKSAPRVLKSLTFSTWVAQLPRRFERGLSEGSPTMFWVIVGLVAVWVNVEMLVRLPIVACLEPDTVGYLTPSAIRSSGYMMFIQLVVALTGDLKWIYPVQLNVMLLSFATLGYVVRRGVGSQGAGLVVAVIPMVSSGLLVLAPAVMSEALFAALISFHLAGMIWCLKNPSWAVLLGVGLTLGLMIVVRPNGLSFVVSALVLIWLLRRYWRRASFAIGLPLMVLIGLQGLYHQQHFGFFGLHKFGSISLVGNYAPLIRAEMGGAYPGLAADLEQQLAHYSRDFPSFEQRSYPFEMAKVAEYTTVGAIYRIILPTIRARLGLEEPKAVAFEYDPRISEIAGDLAVNAVFNDPWGAVKIVTSNFISAWDKSLPLRVPMAVYFPRCGAMNQEIYAKHTKLIAQAAGETSLITPETLAAVDTVGAEGLRLIEVPRMVIAPLQKGLAYLALLLSFWASVRIFWAPTGVRTDLIVTGLAGVSVLGGYGLISLGNTAFTRYTVVFDPVLIVMLTAFGAYVINFLFLKDKNPSGY